MNKTLLISLSTAALLLIQASSYACCMADNNRWAIGGTLSTMGNVGAGVTNYGRNYEVGLEAAGHINNADDKTAVFTPTIFGGMRNHIARRTFLAYGVDANMLFGQSHGATINSDYTVGPYVSLEHYLTHNVLLVGWIDPYSYNYAKIGGIATETNNFFNTGGVGLSYVFD